VRLALAGHKQASPALLERLAHDPNWSVVHRVARRKRADLSPELLTVLSRSSSYNVYTLVAANSKTPPETLRELVGKHIADDELAGNPSLPPDLLEAFVSDVNNRLIESLTKNPSLSADQIERLAQRALQVPEGRGLGHFCYLAHHRRTTVEQLERWARIPLTEVQHEVAKSRRTPIALLEYLARTAPRSALSGIVVNPNVTPQILELLAVRAVEMKPLTDAQILQAPEYMRHEYTQDRYYHRNALLKTVVKHPLCPRSVFDLLLPETDEKLLRMMVENLACPGDILERLWPHLERLGLHENLGVLVYFAANPNCPPHLLEQMFQSLGEVAPRFCEAMLHCLARNPNTPAAVLEQISYQTDWRLLECLAENPNCPPDVLRGIQLEAVLRDIKLKNNLLER